MFFVIIAILCWWRVEWIRNSLAFGGSKEESMWLLALTIFQTTVGEYNLQRLGLEDVLQLKVLHLFSDKNITDNWLEQMYGR